MPASHLHLVEESKPAPTRAKALSPGKTDRKSRKTSKAVEPATSAHAATSEPVSKGVPDLETASSGPEQTGAQQKATSPKKAASLKKAPSPKKAAARAKALTRKNGAPELDAEPAQPKPATRKKVAKAPQQKKRPATAADVMTTPAVSCSVHAPLNEAARLLWEHDLGAVVVVDDEGKAASVITDRDICMAAYTQGVPLGFGTVASAMARRLVSCAVNTSLDEVRERMAEAQVRRLPVVDETGRPVGVLGLSDVLRESLETLPKDRKRGSSTPAMIQLFDAVLAPVSRPSSMSSG